MEREKYERFLNKKVAVEVPNRVEAGKTFAYFGVVKEVYEDSLLVERDGKETLISFRHILEIREEY